MFTRKLTWAYLEILVPYLDNPSEEAIFGSNQIKDTLKAFEDFKNKQQKCAK